MNKCLIHTKPQPDCEHCTDSASQRRHDERMLAVSVVVIAMAFTLPTPLNFIQAIMGILLFITKLRKILRPDNKGAR